MGSGEERKSAQILWLKKGVSKMAKTVYRCWFIDAKKGAGQGSPVSDESVLL